MDFFFQSVAANLIQSICRYKNLSLNPIFNKIYYHSVMNGLEL